MATQTIEEDSDDQKPPQIELTEWDRSDPVKLTTEDQEFLEKIVNDSRQRVSVEFLPEGEGRAKLHSRQFVGLFVLPSGRRVTIDSKVGSQNLVWLIRYANQHESEVFDEPIDLEEGKTFLDLFAYVYLDELDRVLQRGLSPAYNTVERSEDHLRGQLQMDRQIQRHGETPLMFECKHRVQTYDTVLNRGILQSTSALAQLVTSQSLQDLLRSRTSLLRQRVSNVPVTAREIDNITLTRLTDHYAQLRELAVMILEGSFVDTFYQGSSHGVSILLNMNVLFEKVVDRAVRAALEEQPGYTVQSQESLTSLLKGSPRVTIRPDFAVSQTDKTTLVGDAKWKMSRHNSDIYQLVAYEIAEDASGVLVYPKAGAGLETEYVVSNGLDLRLIELPVGCRVADYPAFQTVLREAIADSLLDLL